MYPASGLTALFKGVMNWLFIMD